MAPLRLRHPEGVSTIQLDLSTSTVEGLQEEIYKLSGIPHYQQEIKSGYPPRAHVIVPELPLSSLGLKAGDQVIVSRKAGFTVQSSATTTGRSDAISSGSKLVSGISPRPETVSQQPQISSKATGPDSVATDGGFLIHRVVPDDNSCLFSSVAIVFEQDIAKATHVRKIVADGIRSDMETYSEAILGCPRDQYIATILKPSTWGGAIELSVLAKHYATEIASVDVETGRIDRFEPPTDMQSGNRCILVYSGIHYDAASLSPMEDAPPEWHQTVFPIVAADAQDPILGAAKKLVDILRSKRAFTNTSTFDLKCQDCGQGLKGEKGAREHAQQTGHVRFGEY
ncbi:hypothetical protein SERLA73DRAFT_189819 [Serpula lacrymans var. lacrymans S7.3]|uniref:Ubiquitin thioesterase OTU n=2 Tax=Serpula lacrymans var. lacrymans TaxID=341189 RepID=F8QEL5_SERL3|nr:uncharacterized protein SERLADRAFT_480934 [Serpula lacrymans var. lacrymans S7.9]EGN93271.1 hypothetical protein SERLA73DRAFT_189819 [Serpula lacrymans var. lacrymans S7.3]EGO18654.1 hypothetical protein SERLADRAFT_480934 [Serpula lacrymans var. lacrymans S7.9]